jgi:hypothetical protein
MARSEISVPDFDFSAFYYVEILERLVEWLRANVPEISSEDPAEPAIQLLRAFALIGHLCNVKLDIVAHETLMPTAQLRDSVVAHMKLIGYRVPGDRPATVEMLLTLARTFTADTVVVPEHSLFGTKRTALANPVLFEAREEFEVARTDQLTACYVYDESADTYTDRTSNANTDSDTFQALPAAPANNDALYIGHSTALTNQITIGGLSVDMAGVTGVWEYSNDDLEDDRPDSVAVDGSGLRVEVDGLLGNPGASRAGLIVRVALNEDGTNEDCEVQWDGANFILTSSYLGQVTPSTTASDYTVGTYWHELSDVADGTEAFTDNGDISFTLPKNASEDWQPIEVNGTTAYWLRFRVISVATPTAPTLDRIKWDQGDLYVAVECTQGQSQTEDPLASSDGSADQEYVLGASPVIDGTIEVTVDGVEWTEVTTFLNSTPIDHHYTTFIDSDGVASIRFGDGTLGRIPASGTNNIAVTYRTGAGEDGNVGADKVIVNRSGISYVRRVTNPRPATGWAYRRGGTPSDLELVKEEGPASLRALSRAVTLEDAEYLATQFQTEAGSSPFARVKAVEEGFGPKTVKLIVVGTNGDATTISDREELEQYFNGDPVTGTSGVMVANNRAYPVDYTPVPIDVTATVTGGNQASIEAALTNLLSPLAKDEDGNYIWLMGGTLLARNKIMATIFHTDTEILDVTLTAPAGNTTLAENELPTVGTLTITVV